MALYQGYQASESLGYELNFCKRRQPWRVNINGGVCRKTLPLTGLEHLVLPFAAI